MAKTNWRKRLYEMIPGILLLATFVGSLTLSFIRPLWVIYFVIAFDLYWLMRVLHFIFYVSLSFSKYKKVIKIDWLEKVKTLPKWERIYHIIYLPTAGEPVEVLRSTFQSLAKSNYPKDRMIVVLGGEERLGNDFPLKAEQIVKEFGSLFYKLLVTIHPDGREGEIRGKGANSNWMGQRSKELVDALGIPYENLVVSYFDSDTCVHPQYYAYLSYRYLTHPNPTHVSFQPVVLYNNNIWESPAAMRVTAFATAFWLLTELMRPERMYTFSSHSMSFRALVDVDFWQKDIVTDDSRIFLQCFFRYNGKYAVEPLYIPVSMDTVYNPNYWKGFKSLYKQQRRWGWGVEHFPYMMMRFRENKQKNPAERIPWPKRFKYVWNLTEGMYSWASAPLLIFVLGRLPLWVASRSQTVSLVLVQNTPYVLAGLMNAAMVGLCVSALIGLLMLPPRPQTSPRWKYLMMLLQWILLPIALVIFGSIPAIEAQMRLMLGKKFHLGFFVTPKSRGDSAELKQF